MNAMLAKALVAMVVMGGAVVAQPDGNRVTVGAGAMMRLGMRAVGL